MQPSSGGLPARPAETLPGPLPSPSIPATPRVAGFGGKSSKGRILAAVCCANLVLLCAAFYFGATHRGEVPLQGKELEFHHIRTTLSKHPQLTFQEVLQGVDLVLELYGVSSQEAETTIIKDKVVHLHTASRQALLNFSFFSAAGAAVAVDGFYFTVFLSSEKVEVWNFTRFCWDLTSEVEHLSEHGEGQEVLLQDPHRPNGEGFPSRSRATTFFFQTAEHFLVSITKGDDLSNGMDIFFSGENLVGSVCEASGELKHGMYVEIIRGEYRGYRGTVDISNGQFKVKLVNGTKLQVGEMYCRPLEEDVHWLEKEWQEEHLHGQRCEGLVDVERTCSKDGCTVLLAPEEVSCESFCEAHHLHCNEAWASQKDSCETSAPAPCAAKMSLRGEQLLCRCQPLTLSRLGQEVHLGAHVLLNSRAAVVTKVPDRHGHLEVETPELVTLNTPSFELHNHSDPHGSHGDPDPKATDHRDPPSCEEVKQGEEVRFTAGKFKGHHGAMMSCDPVSQEYRVMLSERIRVHAFDVRVVHCETLKYFGQSCSHDHCELAPSETAESCQAFCNGHDLRCLKAWIHDSHSDSKTKRCADSKRSLVPCDHPGGVRNKLCECTPHVFVDDCFQKGVSFSPQNMEGQFRSHEPSASACAQRCASVVGCAHFSFWTDGGCHLQDLQGKMEERPGVTSGPPDCLAPSILATPVASSRCEEGISYRPLDMYGELRTKEPSLNDCAARCHRVDGCVHFSYWLDGGCHLQDGKASKKGTLGAISGPASGCRQLENKGEVTKAVPVVPQQPRWSSHNPFDSSPASLGGPCGNLVDVQTLCSATQGSCKVMVHSMSRRSCFDYCEQQSLRCISTTSRCHGGEEVGCETITGSNLMACHCEAPSHRNDAPEVEESWKFHCHGDQLGWSREKRWWCCRELEIGCEGIQRSGGTENCSGNAKFWSQDKKDLCCRQQGICQVNGLRQRQQVLKNLPPVPQIPFMMQGYRASPVKTTSKVMRWLTRKEGVFVLCLLTGVALLSLLPLLCRSKESVASKEGYLPVATQES